MRIKRLLVVPCDMLVSTKVVPGWAAFFGKAAAYFSMRFGHGGFTYDGEIQFYGDFPAILGRENVYVYGRFHPHLHLSRVPANSAYPSCQGLPEGTTIYSGELTAALSKVDAVFVSTRAGERGKRVIDEAGKRGIPRALFDFEDHHELYGALDVRRELTYGYRAGDHFEVYFKKELPLGYRTDTILPLAPTPVRPESYSFPDGAKRHSIFYSGRSRPSCQADRDEVLALLRGFPDSEILDHGTGRGTFLATHEYWRYLAESRMALSPSGKSWDSFRHCEVGLSPKTALIAPKPYIETAGPPLCDSENAILYDTEFRGEKYHISRGDELVEKIRNFLSKPDELAGLAKRWQADVISGHTVNARSAQILKMMEGAVK